MRSTSSTRWRAAAPPSGRRRTGRCRRRTFRASSSASSRRSASTCGRRRICTPSGRATGKPGDPAFDQFYASQFPSLVDFPLQQALNRDATVALLDRIGPAVLLIHSQSGAFVWPIADKRPNLVKAIVAVEPNGPPAHDVEFKGAPDWFEDDAHTKAAGLEDVPLTYDPPVTEASPLKFVREDKPEKPESRALLVAGRSRRASSSICEATPILIVTSEASYHAPYDHCTVRYLAQAGVKSTFIRLPDVGVHGNGHMMMLEKNSDDIAKVMADWLDRALPGER